MTPKTSSSSHEAGAFLLLLTLVVGVYFCFWREEKPNPNIKTAGFTQPAEVSGKKKKRAHNLPAGSISSKALTLMMIGDGLRLTRTGPETKIPVGYGVSIVIPRGMTLVGYKDGEVVIVTAESGAPHILLPVIGKLWPVNIVRMRLEGDLLTVELDGWSDYQIHVTPLQ